MTPPTIRALAPADREAAIALLLAGDPWRRLGYTRADWERVFAPLPAERDGYALAVDGRLAGFALVRRKFLLGDYLELLAVDERLRGQGLARALLAAIEAEVFARSRNFYACVSDFNAGARAFYRRCGYAEVGVLPALLVADSAEILLRKTTGPLRALPPAGGESR
jgi:GNAT superfamily N-acetyltransferase